MGKYVIGPEAVAAAWTSTPKHGLGTMWYDVVNDKSYVYVQAASAFAGTPAAGYVMYGSLTDLNTVTDDVSTSNTNRVAGVAVYAPTASYYGWLQTWGECSDVKINTDSFDAFNYTNGDLLIGNVTADGCAAPMTAGTAARRLVIGIAGSTVTAADTAVDAMLTIRQ